MIEQSFVLFFSKKTAVIKNGDHWIWYTVREVDVVLYFVNTIGVPYIAMDYILLSAVIFFFGSVILVPIFLFAENHFYVDPDKKVRFYMHAVLGAIIFCCSRCHVTLSVLPKIDQILRFRSPLSRFLIGLANMAVGKIYHLSPDNALIDQFFFVYDYIDHNATNIFLALLFAFLMTAVSLVEFSIIYICYFPELFFLPRLISIFKFTADLPYSVPAFFKHVRAKIWCHWNDLRHVPRSLHAKWHLSRRAQRKRFERDLERFNAKRNAFNESYDPYYTGPKPYTVQTTGRQNITIGGQFRKELHNLIRQ